MAFVLIGFMGAGKSTLALELAAALGGDAHDSDALLVRRLGHPPAQEFELHGEQSFRAAEEELVCELLASAGPRTVIALGGGSVLSERVRGALAAHVTVLVDVDVETAWERVRASPGGLERPLAREREAFLALYSTREAIYEQLADAIVVRLAPLGAGARIAPALNALAAAPEGTRLLWASAASGGYPVLVGRGLLGERNAVVRDDPLVRDGRVDEVGRVDATRSARSVGAEQLDRIWPLARSSSRAFCVSDEVVGELYIGRLGALAGTIAIARGEGHKTLASAEHVWSALVAAGITRADHVVALGGGVVGDLAGFCAATYQRGVPIVHVPTTLVAQVDSAYGGKTGVDLPQAKNYVGAYHQPAGVLADPDTLATLPPQELAAGWVEVLKTALIAGGSLWETVSGGRAVDEHVILACARTKLAVVAADERDGGRRQVLNLGHTIGHAIETVTEYARYRHGEAVGLGLLAALTLSGQAQLREQVRGLMLDRGLPVTIDDDAGAASVDGVLAAVARDKKRVADDVPFVLVGAPGDVRFGCTVGSEELRAAVAELWP